MVARVGSAMVAEIERLNELDRLQILDTPAEPEFDKIVQLARSIFDAPIVLISLVDLTRQWFKASCGLDTRETAREISFCTHAIEHDRTFVVHDAAEDALFADNPLVVGAPGIRFYAGARLVTEKDLCVGTLCIIDTKPRPGFRNNDAQILESLASVVIDEMDLRLANRAIAAERERADAENRARSNFVATICHEIRAPVFAITSLTELARSRHDVAEIRDDLGRIEQSGSVLLQLIDDVFDVSRIDTDTLELDEHPFDLSETVENAVSLLATNAAQKGIELKVETDSELPPLLIGDSTRLTQVIVNLVGNAVKFTDEGIVCVSARVTKLAGSIAEVLVSVRDTGVGIPATDVDRIFDFFYKAAPTPNKINKGIGLGLAISHRLVALMGGRIAVSSQEGSGSEFSFMVRMAIAVPAENEIRVVRERDKELRDALSGAHVLLVDDDETSRYGISGLLRNCGITVTEADNGRTAVSIALEKHESLDAVLMDMQMPLVNGLDATRRIREKLTPEELPVIALTGMAFHEDRRKCLDAGMNDFLPKPTSVSTICKMLHKHVARPKRAESAAGMPERESEEKLRQRMLTLFRTKYGDAHETVAELLRAGDMEPAAHLLHTLLGAAHFLQLNALADAAGDLESALSGTVDDRTTRSLEHFRETLELALGKSRQPRDGESSA